MPVKFKDIENNDLTGNRSLPLDIRRIGLKIPLLPAAVARRHVERYPGHATAYPKSRTLKVRNRNPLGLPPYPVRCTLEGMKIPADVREAMTEIAPRRSHVCSAGRAAKASARDMTSEERSARAKKASLAAAQVRTAKRLARELWRGPGRAYILSSALTAHTCHV